MDDLEKLKAAMKGKRIHLFGPPGCGKGNRSKDLQALGLIHVASGIALRAKVSGDPDSELSKTAQAVMESGGLVPDEIVVPIVMKHLERPECLDRGFVLDGFPRTKAQADLLFSKIDLDLVLHLDVPRNFLVYGVVNGNRRACSACTAGYSDFDPPKVEGKCDRCGGEIVMRADDNAETIKKRLDGYDAETRAFLPDLEAMGIVEVLAITIGDDEEIDERYLKKLRGEVYRVETDNGTMARMLNLDGMREKLYRFLTEKFA
ncbi:MAG: nucleoside monophosphate kinase [Rhodospirillales bacterium]|nr:nucleoside monophosphate kinase [Rhodospirillales bacterium]